MNIDLSIKAKLDPLVSKRFDEIALDLRGKFNNIISELNQRKGLKNNLDWLLSSPSSRNTVTSPLFFYLVGLKVIDSLLKENFKISKIIVDSEAQKLNLKKLFKQHSIKIEIDDSKIIKSNKFYNFMMKVKIVKNLLNHKLLKLKWAKKSIHLNKKINPGSLTLIDIFIFSDSDSKDNYYPGLLNSISKKNRSKIYFVPTIINMYKKERLINLYKKLRQSNKNFLLKEDFLTKFDIYHAILHFLRIRFIKITDVYFLNLDISNLVNEEISNLHCFDQSVEAFLNIRFSKRINKANIKLKLVINWFENQIIDKGWNFGFFNFFPNINKIGLRACYASPLYLSYYPLISERENNILPDQVNVGGIEQKCELKQFDPHLKVKIGPSLRFQHVWENKKTLQKDFTIFIPLPIDQLESESLIKILNDQLQNIIANKIKLIIKPHPAMNMNCLKNLLNTINFNYFKMVNDSFKECLCKSDLIISLGETGTVMEALAYGIPVIIIRNNRGLTYNSIPPKTDEVIWSIYEPGDDLMKLIDKYIDISNNKIFLLKQVGKKIRNKYFKFLKDEEINDFLDIK